MAEKKIKCYVPRMGHCKHLRKLEHRDGWVWECREMSCKRIAISDAELPEAPLIAPDWCPISDLFSFKVGVLDRSEFDECDELLEKMKEKYWVVD